MPLVRSMSPTVRRRAAAITHALPRGATLAAALMLALLALSRPVAAQPVAVAACSDDADPRRGCAARAERAAREREAERLMGQMHSWMAGLGVSMTALGLANLGVAIAAGVSSPDADVDGLAVVTGVNGALWTLCGATLLTMGLSERGRRPARRGAATAPPNAGATFAIGALNYAFAAYHAAVGLLWQTLPAPGAMAPELQRLAAATQLSLGVFHATYTTLVLAVIAPLGARVSALERVALTPVVGAGHVGAGLSARF